MTQLSHLSSLSSLTPLTPLTYNLIRQYISKEKTWIGPAFCRHPDVERQYQAHQLIIDYHYRSMADYLKIHHHMKCFFSCIHFSAHF